MSQWSDDQRSAWRARREARRAKQRLENVSRAQAMHAARLAAEKAARQSGGTGILPVLRPGGRRSLPRRTTPSSLPTTQTLHIGCSGWYYWHWKGQFYAAELPSSRWFNHYAARFNTVELNAPFYSWPTIATVRTWLRQAGRRRFIYTIKASELITHTKRFCRVRTLVRDFGHIADLLGPRMGCLLFQLPPSLKYSPAALRRIVEQLDPTRRNVVEFRHKTWWNDTVYEAFRSSGITFCSTSGPRLPDELIKTSDDLYIRFHGTKRWYRHDYTREELEVWADRIRTSGAKRVWAYFNNDREGFAIKNARMLRSLLRQ